MNKKQFIEAYSQSIENGSAAVFVGAGVSQAAGYPSWKSLLADVATELGLNIDREHDLAGVAQYYLNRSLSNRLKIATIIHRHFPPPNDVPPVLRVLARLPIRTIWTTNYDKLIEKAWELQDKMVEVKSRNQDIPNENPWAHSALYKMHGTVDHPSDVVLARNDYEIYRRERQGFHQLLMGNLISKHFLFLGFSFTDPNLSYVFGLIREAFHGETLPDHYAIVRRPKRNKGLSPKTYSYTLNRHGLWVEDLKRYGINCIEVDEYAEMEGLLVQVEKRIVSRSVFVSGSFPEDGETAERNRLEEIASGVGRLLAKRGMRLVSGFGLVIGSATVTGLLEDLYKSSKPNMDRSLCLRPFPQRPPKGFTRAQFIQRYREDLLSKAGVCIFISGAKKQPGRGTTVADGVLQEFAISVSNGILPIPVGVSGGAALNVWNQVSKSFRKYYPGMSRKHFDRLNNSALSSAQILEAVNAILDWAEHNR
jgi:hypothetical protein